MINDWWLIVSIIYIGQIHFRKCWRRLPQPLECWYLTFQILRTTNMYTKSIRKNKDVTLPKFLSTPSLYFTFLYPFSVTPVNIFVRTLFFFYHIITLNFLMQSNWVEYTENDDSTYSTYLYSCLCCRNRCFGIVLWWVLYLKSFMAYVEIKAFISQWKVQTLNFLNY